jgi:hypothetical protein
MLKIVSTNLSDREGWKRRRFIQAGTAGLVGTGLAKLIAAEPPQAQAYEEYYADKNKLFVDTNGSTVVEPCERSLLSFPEQHGKGGPHVSLAPDGTMFIAVATAVGDLASAFRSSQKLFLSRDGGHTWSGREMDLPGFSPGPCSFCAQFDYSTTTSAV